MATILAYTSPALGNLYPIIALLIELQRRGHRIVLRTLADGVSTGGELGFESAAIDPRIEAVVMTDWMAPNSRVALKVASRIFAERAAYEVEDLRGVIADVQPDALVIDANSTAWPPRVARSRRCCVATTDPNWPVAPWPTGLTERSDCTSFRPASHGATATSNRSTPASATNASTSTASGHWPRPASSSATGNTTTTTTAATQPWATNPQPATLPPVPTNERLSFAVNQFTGSGHRRNSR